ncbi:Hypothetical protein CINCED_3A018032 [Cinara cedri]|nr:Hypothetical protein CINCED_3A018032 [Cinara cedri]
MPDIPLPPEPIITRWGTWLNTALFYANNFLEYKNIVESLMDDTTSIKNLK